MRHPQVITLNSVFAWTSRIRARSVRPCHRRLAHNVLVGCLAPQQCVAGYGQQRDRFAKPHLRTVSSSVTFMTDQQCPIGCCSPRQGTAGHWITISMPGSVARLRSEWVRVQGWDLGKGMPRRSTASVTHVS